MAVSISYVDSYKHYGKCVKLENGSIEALITIEVGPRIIYLGVKGGENLLFNDDADVRVSRSPLFKQFFGEDAEYHFYGGHRMWLAPQHQIYTESPDSFPVDCKEIENGVVLTCPEAKVLKFVSAMTVVLDPEKAELQIKSEFTNTADKPKKNAVWMITQCAPGGVGFYPLMKPFRMGMRKPFSEMTLDDIPPCMLPSGNIVYFLGAGDDRLQLDDQYITLDYSAERRRPIKIGTMNTSGWAMYAGKGQMLTFRFGYDPDAVYTDYTCNFESYTDSAFTEVETLGPLVEFGRGETISHSETISIQPLKSEIPDLNDRAAVKAFVEEHL